MKFWIPKASITHLPIECYSAGEVTCIVNLMSIFNSVICNLISSTDTISFECYFLQSLNLYSIWVVYIMQTCPRKITLLKNPVDIRQQDLALTRPPLRYFTECLLGHCCGQSGWCSKFNRDRGGESRDKGEITIT